MVRLTKAQVRALKSANEGGVFCRTVDPGYRTLAVLMNLNFLTRTRDEWGYYNITPAGRQALEAHHEQ